MLQKTLGVRLDNTSLSDIQALAKSAERKPSDIARLIIRRHLAEHGRDPRALLPELAVGLGNKISAPPVGAAILAQPRGGKS